MKKLALKLDELVVETFAPAAGPAREAGTVFGNDGTSAGQRLCECDTDEGTCVGDWTCDYTCGCGTGATCGCQPSTYDETCATGSQRLCECWE